MYYLRMFWIYIQCEISFSIFFLMFIEEFFKSLHIPRMQIVNVVLSWFIDLFHRYWSSHHNMNWNPKHTKIQNFGCYSRTSVTYIFLSPIFLFVNLSLFVKRILFWQIKFNLGKKKFN